MSSLVADIAAAGMRLARPVRNVSVRMATGGHTLVIVSTGLDARPTSAHAYIPEGTAVRMTWGNTGTRTSYWYGYCHHHQAAADGTVEYVLIGTSALFDTDSTRTWRDVTASYVIRTLATDAGLRVFARCTPQLLDYVGPGADTDWQLMQQLADDAGYRLWADNATVYLTSPREVIVSPWLRSPVRLTYHGRPGDSLRDLVITDGEAVPVGGIAARRAVYGLTPAGRLVQAVANPTGSARTLTAATTATSYSQAQLEADAAAGRNDHWVTATATAVSGDVRLAPGTLLQVSGEAVASGGTGLWLVDEAEHHLDLATGVHVTYLTLGRNASTRYQLQAVERMNAAAEHSRCVLVNGRWRADRIEEVIYGDQ